MTATCAPAEHLDLPHPDDEAGLFAADQSDSLGTLCWFCRPEDQPHVPDGADYTFAVCRRCQAAANAG